MSPPSYPLPFFSPSLISLTVSVDVKHHVVLLTDQINATVLTTHTHACIADVKTRMTQTKLKLNDKTQALLMKADRTIFPDAALPTSPRVRTADIRPQLVLTTLRE